MKKNKKTNTNVAAQVFVFLLLLLLCLSTTLLGKEEAAENHIARKVYRQITQAAERRRRPRR